MPDAVVLGGGGTKAAFTVGALLRLYEAGVHQNIIFGASAGSLNALKLAEAPQETAQPGRIRDFWRQLRTNSDMYVARPWLSSLPADVQSAVDAAVLLIPSIAFPPFFIFDLRSRTH